MINYDEQIALAKSKFKEKWSTTSGKISITLLVLFDLFLILSVAAVFIFPDPILNGIVKTKIENSINEKGKYELKIGNINFHPFSNSFDMSNIQFNTKDISGKDKSIYINIPALYLGNPNWLALVFGSGLHLNKIEMNYPFVKLIETETGGTEKTDSTKLKNKIHNLNDIRILMTSSIPEKLLSLEADELTVNSAAYIRQMNLLNRIQTVDSVKSLSVKIEDIELDKKTGKKTLAFAEDVTLSIKGINHFFRQSKYRIKIDSLSLSTRDSLLILKSVKFEPDGNDNSFFADKKYKMNRYRTSARIIKTKGIDYARMANESSFIINKVFIDSFLVDILTNKRLPNDPNSPNPKMPNQLITSFKSKLKINAIHLSKGIIKYGELFPYSDEPAILPFTNTSGVIENVANFSADKKAKPAEIKVTANLADAGKLSVNMNYNLLSSRLSLKYNGSLDSMDMTRLNSFLKLDAGIIVKSAKVKNIFYDVNVDSGHATGIIKPIYADLKIEVLNKEESKTNILTKIISLIARKTKIHESNPQDDEFRTGNVNRRHTEDEAFFHFIWVSLREALKETVGF